MTEQDESHTRQEAADRDSYLEALPRKVIAAGALIRDTANRVCVVEPTYKDQWLFPGGTVNAGESPSQACRREVHEELGLDLEIGRVLGIDWADVPAGPADQLAFLYDGGVLQAGERARIKVPADELRSFAFVDPVDLESYLSPRNALRCRAALNALDTGTVVELDRS